MTKNALFALAVLSSAANVAFAVDFGCTTDRRTDATECIDVKQVREDNGIRYAKLYSGGPKTVRPTNFTIHANCKTGVVHLKDRDGVSFAGGSGNETPMLRELRDMLCGASVRK
jgi:hypothetical protein